MTHILIQASHTLTPLTVILLILWVFMKRAKGLPKLTVKQRNWWVIAHVASAVLYFAGVLGMTLMALSAKFTANSDLIYAAHLYIQYFDWFLIIPGGMSSLLTGFWLCLRTPWGFTKYYWVIVKWVGNIFAILFGSSFMRIWIHEAFPLIFSGNTSPLLNPAYLRNRQMLFIGIVISITILTSLMIISYLKPWGQRRTSPGR